MKVDEQQTDYYLPTLRAKGFFSKLTGLFRQIVAFIAVFALVKRNSLLIFYHHPNFSWMIHLLKMSKNIRIVLEVEEVYYKNNKSDNKEKLKKQEEVLFDCADAYLTVNDLIYRKYLNDNKPNVVIYGSYIMPEMPEIVKKNDRIRVLFSGSIDKVRGAHLAVKCAQYLNENYCIEISGSGLPSEVESLIREIEESNNKNKCKILFHGQLDNNVLEQLAFSCDFGLNLQDITNPFEEVSFPSKISFYLMHGLSVVSTKMSSVVNSKLCEAVLFTDQKPESIRQAVL